MFVLSLYSLSCPTATFQLFRYFQEVTKKNGGTACSSRGSYSTILPEILLFARFSRIQWTGTAFDTTTMRRAEPFRRIGGRGKGGEEGNDSERSADKAEVSRPRDNCQRKRNKTFFIPSSSLSLCPMNAVEMLITVINARKILSRFVDSSVDAMTLSQMISFQMIYSLSILIVSIRNVELKSHSRTFINV